MKKKLIFLMLAFPFLASAKTIECQDYRDPSRKITADLNDAPKKMNRMKGDIRDLKKIIFTVGDKNVLVVKNILAEIVSLQKGDFLIHLISPNTAKMIENGFEIFGNYTTGVIEDGKSRILVVGGLNEKDGLKEYAEILNKDLAQEHIDSRGLIIFSDVACRLK